jgi:Na+/H+-dicarboxylate symporter
VPVAPLGLLVAVETIPDIFRTLGNVTMDLATTVTVSARSGEVPETEGDALLRT